MKPQSYPAEMKKSLVKAKPLPISRREAYPNGTVPIQITTKDDLLKARNYSKTSVTLLVQRDRTT